MFSGRYIYNDKSIQAHFLERMMQNPSSLLFVLLTLGINYFIKFLNMTIVIKAEEINKLIYRYFIE